MKIQRLGILIALLATACAPAATTSTRASTSTSGSTSTTAATTTPPTTAGTTPTTLNGGSSHFEVLSADPVVVPLGGERYVNPGAVVEVEGVLHMLSNSFTFYPGHSEVWHSTSTDGLTWEVAGDTMVFGTNDVPYSDGNVFVFAAYVTDSGEWVAYFDSYDGQGDPGFIGRMTAPGPDGPWEVDSDPVLAPGDAGSWDDGRVGEPSILQVDGGLLMFYTGFDVDGRAAIGRAESSDGIEWAKTGPGPVVTPPAWAGPSINGAQVVEVDDGFLMLYQDQTAFNVGTAKSADTLSWDQLADGPIARRSQLPTGDELYQSELIFFDGSYLWLQEIGPGNSSTAIYALELLADELR